MVVSVGGAYFPVPFNLSMLYIPLLKVSALAANFSPNVCSGAFGVAGTPDHCANDGIPESGSGVFGVGEGTPVGVGVVGVAPLFALQDANEGIAINVIVAQR